MIITFKLDKRSTEPIYKQLISAIVSDIQGGRFTARAALPSSRDLADAMDVSRDTVIKAYRELHRLGYLVSDTTSGTFVNPDKIVAPGPKPAFQAIDQSTISSFARKIGRDLVKHPSSPDFAGLNYGAVPRAALPMRRWRELMQLNCVPETFRKLEYEPDVLGRPELRAALRDYLARSKGITATAEQVTVFSVSSGILNVLLKLLTEPGQSIVVEDPGFGVIRNIARSHNLKVIGVPVDSDGLVVSELERLTDKIKVVYITPNHHDPTGAIMSVERRRQLLDWASRHSAWILEDDYDGNFYYTGEPPEHFWTMSPDANVVYINSFWQILYPLTSISVCVLPQNLVPYVKAVKQLQTEDMADTMVQLTLSQLMADGYLERHLSKIQKSFSKRRLAAMQALKSAMGEKVAISTHSAGNYFIVHFSGLSDQLIASAADRAGLPLVSTASYYLGQPVPGEYLLNFTLLSEENAAHKIYDFARELP